MRGLLVGTIFMDLAGPMENYSTQTRELNKQLYFVARFFRPHVLSAAAAFRPKKEEEKRKNTHFWIKEN